MNTSDERVLHAIFNPSDPVAFDTESEFTLEPVDTVFDESTLRAKLMESEAVALGVYLYNIYLKNVLYW